MSYQALIDANLNRAFNLIKDLAKDIVLTRQTNPNFDFGTGTAKFGTPVTVATKAVIIEDKKPNDNRNTIKRQMMLKTKEIGDINQYTTVSINNETWNIGDVIKNDGFITLADIHREA